MNLRWLLHLAIAATAPYGILGGQPALFNDYGFDREAYGIHPMQKFRSIDVEVPLLNIIQSSPKCEQDLYTMMAPRGLNTGKPQITMLDKGGNLVWTTAWKDQQLYNLMVQEYKGEKYITFWGGDDAVGGHGAGKVYMVRRAVHLSLSHYDGVYYSKFAQFRSVFILFNLVSFSDLNRFRYPPRNSHTPVAR